MGYHARDALCVHYSFWICCWYPLGDLVFTFTITRIFKFIRARLAGARLLVYLDAGKIEEIFGIVPGVDCDQEIPCLHETSFVDDGAQPLVAPAQDIVKNSIEAMAITDSEFTRCGPVLNYSQGRTEVLVVFKGKESYKYRVKLLVEMGGIISVH